MIKRTLHLVTVFAVCCWSTSRAADAADTNAPAGTNAPAAAAPADTGPKPDPSGQATGASSDGASADGTTFVATAPADLSADDKKDPAKVKAYNEAKKAFDDYTAQAKLEPLAVKLSDSVGHNRVAINFMWTLITGFLVMFMQAGFALVETGLCRAKNAGHTMSMNFMIYPDGHARLLPLRVCLHVRRPGRRSARWAATRGLNHEITWHPCSDKPFGLLGWKGFLLQGAGYDTAAFALFLFQMVFMDTTATIPTGGAAERWKFSAFMIYGCFIGTVMYPVFGNWVWGGGWLSQLGIELRPRPRPRGFRRLLGGAHARRRHRADLLLAASGRATASTTRTARSFIRSCPHNIPMVMLGTFILAFGWFGFNPGSTLAGTDLRIAVVAVNTMLASATGALGATLVDVVVPDQEARPVHDVQRHAGGLGGDHAALRLRQCRRCVHHRLDRRHPGGRVGVLL